MTPKQKTKAHAALRRAITAAGGQVQLAKMLGITQPAVSQWRVAPIFRCMTIEVLTNVPRWELRPDVWGAP